MDRARISQLIYDYTSGYPVLVSGLCKLLDEEIAGTEAFPDKVPVGIYNEDLQIDVTGL